MENRHWKVYILAKSYLNVSTTSNFDMYLCEKWVANNSSTFKHITAAQNATENAQPDSHMRQWPDQANQ